MAQILFVDDDPTVGAILHDTLFRMGHQPFGASNIPEALGVLQRESLDLIILDHRMPGMTGLEFLEYLREEGVEVPVIMLTGHGSIEHAVAAIKAGAVDYITKPVRADQLEVAVSAALELARLRRENEHLRREVMALRHERQIIGDSQQMRQLLHVIATAAPTRATVLLQGESGTGKELAARAIHEESPRRDRPFIQLNCAAIPENLIESALFGHEKGAFTGALKRVEGAFERADGGTLLLDEISEMRLDLQSKLLRVLQEQRFERVGGTSPLSVDVRIIATTNRDLAVEAHDGRFRQDLFYRLSVIPIRIPPLRERKDDIPLLAYRFAVHSAKEVGRTFEGLSPATVQLLQDYDWPGNVRELQHAIERAVILANDPILQPHHFDAARFGLVSGGGGPTPMRGTPIVRAVVAPLAGAPAVPADPDGIWLPSLDTVLAEELLIQAALQRAEGNRTKAALLLNMSVRTLRHKLNVSGKDEA
ncbi:MAG: sigma-54-dependent Fis family transcriptional regulator [Gemmatimonadaceae bacterium]|nr:sigma-54-dependent Fis family transcriptional regulator [Gemmatimonadaceae bacterium]